MDSLGSERSSSLWTLSWAWYREFVPREEGDWREDCPVLGFRRSPAACFFRKGPLAGDAMLPSYTVATEACGWWTGLLLHLLKNT